MPITVNYIHTVISTPLLPPCANHAAFYLYCLAYLNISHFRTTPQYQGSRSFAANQKCQNTKCHMTPSQTPRRGEDYSRKGNRDGNSFNQPRPWVCYTRQPRILYDRVGSGRLNGLYFCQHSKTYRSLAVRFPCSLSESRSKHIGQSHEPLDIMTRYV